MLKKLILISLILFISSCKSDNSMYKWGSYDKSLLNYNKSPMEKEKFALKLQKIIQKSEPSNQVPPGIYAEYGYILLELRKYDEAISYFNKEKTLWPESTKLMDLMIERAKIQNKNTKK